MSINLIMKELPHRYPFLKCDHIDEYKLEGFSRGYKNVSINEPYFQGHFPDEPVMPGVFILETMAQIGGFVFKDPDDKAEKPVKGYIAGFDRVKFLKKVIPGDQLYVEAKFISRLGSIGKINAVAKVDNVKVAVADIIFKFDAE